MTQNKKQHIIYLIIFAGLSLIITLTNLGLKRSFVGDDAGVGYYYADTLYKRVWSMWDEHIFPGNSITVSTIAFLFIQMILALYKVGFNDIFLERLLYFSFFFFSSTGAYFLFLVLIKDRGDVKKKEFAAFTTGVVYAFNYLVTVLVAFPLTNFHVSYVLLPWILYLYIKNFHYCTSFKSIFLFSLILLLLFTGNPASSLSILGFVLFYALVFNKEIKVKKRYLMLLAVLTFSLSSYIYLPILMNKSNPYASSTVEVNEDSLNFNSIRTSFLNLFRFQGYHSAETFSFYPTLVGNPPVILVSFLVALFVIASALFNKYSNKERFFLFSALIFLYLSKGVHPPFSDWFLFLFNKVFVLQMYRATYFKFEMFVVLSFAVLAGFFILKTTVLLNKSRVSRFLWLIPLCLIFGAWPLISGEAARYFHLSAIPQEYNEAREFMKSVLLENKILSLPQVSNPLLKWGDDNYYAGQFFQDSIILDHSVWSSSWFNNNLKKYFSGGRNLNRGMDLLSFYNIKYIFLHKDIPNTFNLNVGFIGRPNGEKISTDMSELLGKMPYVKLKMENKYFNIYEFDDSRFLPQIYTPNKIISSTVRTFDVLDVVGLQYPLSREAVYFANQNKNSNNVLAKISSNFVYNDKTTIEYKKINSTKYKLIVHRASDILPIVFSESYHPGWQIYQTAQIKNNMNLDGLNMYKLFEENADYQMSKDELAQSIKQGVVSTLGNLQEKELEHKKFIPRDYNKIKLFGYDEVADHKEKYNIGYISKNYYGSIQNENIESGTFHETWSILGQGTVREVVGNNHFTANGYANSWVLNVKDLCSNNSLCVKNDDGTYNISLTIEFLPQKFFILGLLISRTIFVTCVVYITAVEIVTRIYRKRSL